MAVEGISHRLEAFIAEHVDSVGLLEVLLLLHAAPDTALDAAAVAKALRVDPAWTEQTMAGLADKRLIARAGDAYRYDLTHAGHDVVDELARAYADRRVTVIGLIFSKPADRLRVFADAFRLFRDK